MYKDDDGSFIFTKEEIEANQKSHNITPLKPTQSIGPLRINIMQQENPPEKQYALYPILPVQGIMFIFSATGVGKTMFTLNLAYAIAAGGNFLRYTAPKPLRVLYVDAEMAYVDIHSRLMQIVNQQGQLDYPENFMLYTPDRMIPPNEKLPIRMPKICSPEGQAFYSEAIERENIDVVVFDNLSMLSTIDLDKAQEWHIINDWQLKLRANNKTIINVHHSGKDKNGYRGTSRMLDAADTAISLQGIDDLFPQQNDSPLCKRFKVVYQKNRSFFGKDALPYEVTLTNGIWSYQSMENTEMGMVIEMVGLKMTQVAIAKELNCGQSKIAKIIKKARQLKLLME